MAPRLGSTWAATYRPRSKLTDHLRWGQPNQIVVRVNSTERADIPPFGGRIDYLTFGGIYREAPADRPADTTSRTSSPSRSTC